MIRVKVDHQFVEVEPGTTLLEAARIAGVEVPAMCYAEGLDHFTSCMVCLVRDAGTGKLIPSCTATATDGAQIITRDEEIVEARKTALELLLSDHVGDCEAPCQISCPAHMDIPTMNRLLAEGKFDEALPVVMNDIALPAVLGYICPAPCEGACRRKPIDGAISICMLKRYAGQNTSVTLPPLLPDAPCPQSAISIVGAGPAGLSAAYYLARRGYRVEMFEKSGEAGGALCSIPEDRLPKEILKQDIARVLNTGVKIHYNTEIDAPGLQKLLDSNDAVILASGESPGVTGLQRLATDDRGIVASKESFQSSIPKLFVIGSAFRTSKMAVRSAGQGKEVAFSVDQFLKGHPVTGEPRLFNSRFGRLVAEEYAEYLKESPPGERTEPAAGWLAGYSAEEVMAEAARCLHCDCRKLDDCKLRMLSDVFNADQKRFRGDERKPVVKEFHHEEVVYEPEKCIKCGICVRITERSREELGLTFIGRGFEVRIGVPYNQELSEGLKKTAREVAEACPTGALSLKK